MKEVFFAIVLIVILLAGVGYFVYLLSWIDLYKQERDLIQFNRYVAFHFGDVTLCKELIYRVK